MTYSKTRIRKDVRAPKLICFNVYFSKRMLGDISKEAARLEKPVGWVIKKAWDLARPQIAELEPDPKPESKLEVDPEVK